MAVTFGHNVACGKEVQTCFSKVMTASYYAKPCKQAVPEKFEQSASTSPN